MKALGAHIYAGGFTLGVMQHFDVVAHCEDSGFGSETVKNNLRIPIHLKPWPTVDDIALIYCNPPCAPWSASSVGRANTWDEDPRLSCQSDCMELFLRHQPKVFMMESVRGMYTKGKSMVMGFVMEAMNHGYATYFVLCDAKEHGVPQNRRRFFLVFSKVEITWEPTNSPELTSGEALANMSGPGDTRKTEMHTGIRWQSIVDKVPQGGTMKKVFAEQFPELVGISAVDYKAANGGVKIGRGSMMLRRLDPNSQAQTFTGDVKTFHPDENRFLTIQEAAVLSGFPEDYKFSGATGLGYNQIARGVLPPVAEYMAQQIKKAIDRGWHPATLDPREVSISRTEVVCDVV